MCIHPGIILVVIVKNSNKTSASNLISHVHNVNCHSKFNTSLNKFDMYHC